MRHVQLCNTQKVKTTNSFICFFLRRQRYKVVSNTITRTYRGLTIRLICETGFWLSRCNQCLVWNCCNQPRQIAFTCPSVNLVWWVDFPLYFWKCLQSEVFQNTGAAPKAISSTFGLLICSSNDTSSKLEIKKHTLKYYLDHKNVTFLGNLRLTSPVIPAQTLRPVIVGLP